MKYKWHIVSLLAALFIGFFCGFYSVKRQLNVCQNEINEMKSECMNAIVHILNKCNESLK